VRSKLLHDLKMNQNKSIKKNSIGAGNRNGRESNAGKKLAKGGDSRKTGGVGSQSGRGKRRRMTGKRD